MYRSRLALEHAGLDGTGRARLPRRPKVVIVGHGTAIEPVWDLVASKVGMQTIDATITTTSPKVLPAQGFDLPASVEIVPVDEAVMDLIMGFPDDVPGSNVDVDPGEFPNDVNVRIPGGQLERLNAST